LFKQLAGALAMRRIQAAVKGQHDK
jgi:hypothetical protein